MVLLLDLRLAIITDILLDQILKRSNLNMKIAFNRINGSTLTILLVPSLVACGGSSGGSLGGGGGTPLTAPKITAVSPAANDASVLVGLAVLAAFDKEMESASANSFVLFGSQTGKLTGVYSVAGRQIVSKAGCLSLQV
jgi:hypothetical protein